MNIWTQLTYFFELGPTSTQLISLELSQRAKSRHENIHSLYELKQKALHHTLNRTL